MCDRFYDVSHLQNVRRVLCNATKFLFATSYVRRIMCDVAHLYATDPRKPRPKRQLMTCTDYATIL